MISTCKTDSKLRSSRLHSAASNARKQDFRYEHIRVLRCYSLRSLLHAFFISFHFYLSLYLPHFYANLYMTEHRLTLYLLSWSTLLMLSTLRSFSVSLKLCLPRCCCFISIIVAVAVAVFFFFFFFFLRLVCGSVSSSICSSRKRIGQPALPSSVSR